MTFENETVLIWMTFPDDAVVHYEVGSERTLGEALGDAMQAPLIGAPRRPGRVRVATARDVREIREHVGAGMFVAQAPTPEIDFLLEQMNDFRARGIPVSWLREVPELDVSGFFEGAARLYAVAPWKTLHEGCLVRVDAPELGLDGAVVSLLGNADREYGFLLFPSLEAHDAFLQGANRSMARGEPIDLGGSWLSLSYDNPAVLSPQLLADVRERGLVVEPRHAYPSPFSHGSDGKLLPLAADDVRTLAAVTRAMGLFFDEFGTDMFDEDAPDAGVTAEYGGETDDDPIVALTAPYWLHEDEGADDAVEDEASDAQLLHQLDRELVGLIHTYGEERLGEDWAKELARLSSRHPPALVQDYVVYRMEVEGMTLADHFAEDFPDENTPRDEWLDAQASSWLSVWEVVEVEADVGLLLRDLLSGEERWVSEVSATRALVAGLVILARVIEFRDLSLLGATHPQPLRPLDADRVVQAVRKRFRKKGDIPLEKLMPSHVIELLMDEWADAVATVRDRTSVPPELHNTDGDALLLTVDHFAFVDPTARAALHAALASMEGVDADGEEVLVLLRPDESGDPRDTTLIARMVVGKTELRVETNSIRRADEVRGRVEAMLGDAIRHRARTHSDPLAFFDETKAAHERGELPTPEPPPPEVQAMLLQVKERYLQKWMDEPIPALDGKTPRQASESADGRRKLDVLLREIELIESQSPGGTRLDVAPIRRELGL